MPGVIFGVLGIGAFVALIVWAIGADKRRTKAVTEAVQMLGWSVQEDAANWLMQGAGQLPVFNNGHSRIARNLMKAPGDVEGAMFDYRYTVGYGRNSQTYFMTCYAKPAPGPFPDFVMRPENLFDKIGQSVFKMKDINFDQNPIFSKRYVLKGTDESAIRNLFSNGGAIQLFEQQTGWHAESNGRWLVVYRNQRVKPDKLGPAMAEYRSAAAALRP